MKVLRLLGEVACCLSLCSILAGADSILLRNGRRLEGKYIGGTTTAIGFMTGGTVQYFATSDVMALIFDSGNTSDSPLSGLQAKPLNVQPSVRVSRIVRLRRTAALEPTSPVPSRSAAASTSSP